TRPAPLAGKPGDSVDRDLRVEVEGQGAQRRQLDLPATGSDEGRPDLAAGAPDRLRARLRRDLGAGPVERVRDVGRHALNGEQRAVPCQPRESVEQLLTGQL